jgi:protein-L-isoaspartate(D-aspartate) O-methyltransferase
VSEFELQRKLMVETQLRSRGIADERVLQAMERVPREEFVPEEYRAEAYADAALPIGEGQTISQPYMVALICQELALGGMGDSVFSAESASASRRGNERVLDVGTGSGYQAAVLAELAREVVSVERHERLAEWARQNLARAGYADRVEVHVGDGSLGWPERAPYDAIAVAAAAPGLPRALYDQLADDGRLVLPVGTRHGQRLEVVVRTPGGPRVARSVPCRFVPLVGEQGFA